MELARSLFLCLLWLLLDPSLDLGDRVTNKSRMLLVAPVFDSLGNVLPHILGSGNTIGALGNNHKEDQGPLRILLVALDSLPLNNKLLQKFLPNFASWQCILSIWQ